MAIRPYQGLVDSKFYLNRYDLGNDVWLDPRKMISTFGKRFAELGFAFFKKAIVLRLRKCKDTTL